MLRTCSVKFWKGAGNPLAPILRRQSLLTLSQCTLNPDVNNAITEGKLLLPIDTSIFMFKDNVDENIQFVRSQIEIAKRMNVVAVPSILLHGNIKIGLSKEDLKELNSMEGGLVECNEYEF
ncbi:hypothetical protein JH06_3080 [Blastocystis sp. subtype 4]|uniref:hypothetical protein n=1 Tax=Blastocystis sp. subtype 4 TaxID=944170 RepID=UPI0007113863|nr:hypothetical protein JH06_3080 [Blastocystis sp. subtype 4]KNB43086.1 hypothetical protein JH06_3080 [Blastocystis sp. subtype 4]|eukprot:XP_014526529.1 hypothetical protein JH06_3080 [Blastocystis sp. subtype 4]